MNREVFSEILQHFFTRSIRLNRRNWCIRILLNFLFRGVVLSKLCEMIIVLIICLGELGTFLSHAQQSGLICMNHHLLFLTVGMLDKVGGSCLVCVDFARGTSPRATLAKLEVYVLGLFTAHLIISKH